MDKQLLLKQFLMSSGSGGLPSIYTQKDYIAGTGTQYLDLGLKGDNNTVVNLDFQLTAIGYNKGLFGSYANNKRYHWFCYSTGIHQAGYYQTYFQGPSQDLNKHKFIQERYNFIIDGQIYKQFSDGTFETATNLLLFKTNGVAVDGVPMKVYSLKIYGSNYNLLRDLIPCVRNSDSEVGMFDLVNKVFYTNQGTGTFTTN